MRVLNDLVDKNYICYKYHNLTIEYAGTCNLVKCCEVIPAIKKALTLSEQQHSSLSHPYIPQNLGKF